MKKPVALLPTSALVVLAACGGGSLPPVTGTTPGSPDPTTGNGTSWTETELGSSFQVSENNVQIGAEGSISLTIDASGAPVATYADDQLVPHARRWDGASWALLAPLPVTAAPEGGVALTRDTDLAPVALWPQYDDATGIEELRAARWTGTWEPLGAAVFQGSVSGVHAATGPKGPIAAWESVTPTSDDVVVARWDGASWVTLGPPKPMIGVGQVAVDSTPAGDPVIAYVTPEGACTAERWDDAAGWQPLPASGAACDARLVEVAVDGTGAVYLAGISTSSADMGYALAIDDVHRLGSGETSWTSLGLPPGLTDTYSRLELAGLPGGGVAAAWTHLGLGVARWTAGAWESVLDGSETGWGGIVRPRLAVTGDTDFFGAYANILNVPAMAVSRFERN